MATSEQIVDVAQELIQKVGFHAFSYRDVADRIGIKTASIHYHFPTKAELALAIVNRVNTAAAAGLQEIDAQETDSLMKLRRFCGMFHMTWGDGDRLCPICMLAMGQDAIPDAVRSGVRAFWQGAEAWVAVTVREGQQRGELVSSLEPETVGRTFVAAMEGAMVAARAFRDRSRLEDVTACLLASVARDANLSGSGRLRN